MLVQLWIEFLRLFERFIEQNHTCRHHFLGRSRFIIGLEFVVGKLENSRLSNLAIDGFAVRALLCLPTLLVDLFAYLRALQVVDSRLS